MFDPRRGAYYLIEVSEDADMGYVELNSGTNEEMKNAKQFYEANADLLDTGKKRLDAMAENVRIRQGDNRWDDVLFEQQGESARHVRFPLFGAQEGEQDTDGARNSSRVERNTEDVMLQSRDSKGNTLSKGQQEFFKDSKVRDKSGNLLVVRHGTNDDFNIFDFSMSGKNGKAEGYSQSRGPRQGQPSQLRRLFQKQGRGLGGRIVPIDIFLKKWYFGKGIGNRAHGFCRRTGRVSRSRFFDASFNTEGTMLLEVLCGASCMLMRPCRNQVILWAYIFIKNEGL